MAYGTALIVVGLALAAAIGLSRVYLGVHYLSDVSGGWALGGLGVRRLRRDRAGRHPLPAECSRRMDRCCRRKIGTEYLLFGGAGLISLLAFAALILAPGDRLVRPHLGEGDRGAASRSSCSSR